MGYASGRALETQGQLSGVGCRSQATETAAAWGWRRLQDSVDGGEGKASRKNKEEGIWGREIIRDPGREGTGGARREEHLGSLGGRGAAKSRGQRRPLDEVSMVHWIWYPRCHRSSHRCWVSSGLISKKPGASPFLFLQRTSLGTFPGHTKPPGHALDLTTSLEKLPSGAQTAVGAFPAFGPPGGRLDLQVH